MMWLLLSAILGILFGIIPIALLIFFIIYLARRSGSRDGAKRGPRLTPVRLYQYIVSFVGLMVAATGVSFILERFIEQLEPSRDVLSNPSEARFASGVAMLIIGGLVCGLHWMAVQRNVQTRGEVERLAPERRLYLRAVSFFSIMTFFIALVHLFRWATTADDFASYPFAGAFVWGIVWLVHQSVADREMPKDHEPEALWQLGIYVTSLYTLVTALVGMAGILNALFSQVRERIFDSTSVIVHSQFNSEDVQAALALLIPGALVWGYHWFYLTRWDRRSTGRALTSFLAGLGGVITVIVAASIFLFGIVWWFLAPQGDLVAALHFRFLSGVLAAAIPGMLAGAYFHLEFHSGAGRLKDRPEEARSLMLGVLSLMGLVALGIAITSFVAAFIGAIAEPARSLLVNQDWWRKPIAVGLATILLGLGLWVGPWTMWNRMKGKASASLMRGYLYGVIGLTMLTLLGAGAHTLYSLLRDIIDSSYKGSWIREAAWSIGVLLAAGACAFYHWRMTKEEAFEAKVTMSQPVAHAPAAQVRVMGLGASPETFTSLRAVLGESAHVEQQTEVGQELARLPLVAIAALPEVLRAHAGKRLLLVVTKDEVRVYADSQS